MEKISTMINANELRIGLWVSNGDRNFRVDGNVIYDADNFETYCNNLEPIPLTSDILIACGFKKTAFYNQYKSIAHGSDFPWIEDNGDGIFDLIVGEPEYSISTFRYLHQLQNLYFALTQKELAINLKTTAT